jgi:N-methylhydantoinase A/oxoprolinase/acetone carboxylase beta subunit
MTVAIGIDTGGTYTDAVVVEQAGGQVLAAAKALTTYQDLSLGIIEAVAQALRGCSEPPDQVDLVALSTTLATNAIVEGRGSPVCLLLIGYDSDFIRQYGLERDLVTQYVAYVRGGHDGLGDEIEPLDEAAARQAILEYRDSVEAFAISGYFGVRNPTHELRLRALVEELTGKPVTCGHELTTRLNAVRRATTATLNARLIPLLKDLIATVRRALGELGIAAPLMVVRGDGSLVRAEWAMQRPIETILSGPAASVVGTYHLAGQRDVWVVDVGGTTTDIAALRDGRPRINPEGAQVGEWRTMVEAVDVHTVGLGGDSEVWLDRDRRLMIGPRRVVPLCLLASQYPTVVDELQRQTALHGPDGLAGQFVLEQRKPTHTLEEADRALLGQLARGPRSLFSLTQMGRFGSLLVRQVSHLERQRLVLRAGFTPTDALHALGRFECWDSRASRLGAELLAARANLSPEALCERVVQGVSDRVTTELLTKVLSDEAAPPDWENEPTAAALLERGLGRVGRSDLDCHFRLRQPVVAIGAPVKAYLPRVSELLQTELLIPEHAEVANALGAVAGGVVQKVRALIRPLEGDSAFRLHLPDGVRDFASVEEAVAYAQEVLPARAEELARQAGAAQVEVQFTREDKLVPVALGWGQEVYLGTELTFTAVGRPGLA